MDHRVKGLPLGFDGSQADLLQHTRKFVSHQGHPLAPLLPCSNVPLGTVIQRQLQIIQHRQQPGKEVSVGAKDHLGALSLGATLIVGQFSPRSLPAIQVFGHLRLQRYHLLFKTGFLLRSLQLLLGRLIIGRGILLANYVAVSEDPEDQAFAPTYLQRMDERIDRFLQGS